MGFSGLTFCCAVIVSSPLALVRTSFAKRSGSRVGDCWLIMAFAGNYSDLSVVLKVRRKVSHGDIIILGILYFRPIVVS